VVHLFLFPAQEVKRLGLGIRILFYSFKKNLLFTSGMRYFIQIMCQIDLKKETAFSG